MPNPYKLLPILRRQFHINFNRVLDHYPIWDNATLSGVDLWELKRARKPEGEFEREWDPILALADLFLFELKGEHLVIKERDASEYILLLPCLGHLPLREQVSRMYQVILHCKRWPYSLRHCMQLVTTCKHCIGRCLLLSITWCTLLILLLLRYQLTVTRGYNGHVVVSYNSHLCIIRECWTSCETGGMLMNDLEWILKSTNIHCPFLPNDTSRTVT